MRIHMALTRSTSGSSAEPAPPSGSGTSTTGARMPAPNSRTRSDRTSRMGGPKVTTTSPKSMREHAEAHATSIAVKREKNQREASRAAAHEHESDVARTAPLGSSKKSKAGRAAAQAHESEVARTDTRGSSKMPQDLDAQFLEDTEKAV